MLSYARSNAFGSRTPAGYPRTAYVRSVQPFEITIPTGATSATASIGAVNTATSVIFFAGFTTTHTGTALREYFPRVELTDSGTVTAYRNTSSATHTVTVHGTVVEFEPSAVTSVQAGTIQLTSANTNNTATISSVNTSRSVVFHLGFTISSTATSLPSAFTTLVLTNATTVTAERDTGNTATVTVGYAVVEFASGITASVQPRSVTLTTTNTSDTDTISSVTTGCALLVYNGCNTANAAFDRFLYNLQLTNGTTVTLTRSGTSASSRTIKYTVLEFASGVVSSLQRGTVAVSSATSADATVTSAPSPKALCNWINFLASNSIADQVYATAKFVAPTTVRGQKNTAGATTSTPGYEVVEFV